MEKEKGQLASGQMETEKGQLPCGQMEAEKGQLPSGQMETEKGQLPSGQMETETVHSSHVPTKEKISHVPAKEKISPVPAKEKISPVPAKEKISPVPAKEKISPVLAKEKISPVPAKEKISPVPAKEKISPVPAKEKISPVPAKEKISPVPAKEKISPVPAKEKISPVPAKEKTSPVPAKEKISPVPAKEKISPVPAKEKISPVPAKEKISPVPAKEKSSGVLASATATDNAFCPQSSSDRADNNHSSQQVGLYQSGTGVRKYRSGYRTASCQWTALLIEEARADETFTVEAATTPKPLIKRPSALYDQGDHEVNIDNEDCEGSIHWTTCKKNPGHIHFILPHEFTMAHLPVSHQDEDIHKYIKLWAQLVVKVKVKDISMDRPQGYAFYKHRGQRLAVTGTGKVTDISLVNDAPCRCAECQMSDSPRQEWLAVWVMTAMHVVFDDYEGSQTEVELFYDREDTRDGVRALSGLRMVDCNLEGDWCKFECATHDLDLGHLLTDVEGQLMELGKTIKEKEAASFSPLAVIASHPHGQCKHITVGVWRDRMLVRKAKNFNWTEYTYTTDTCYGSSGGPVWIVGSDRIHYYYNHVHVKTLPSGLNMSGAGDVDKRWD